MNHTNEVHLTAQVPEGNANWLLDLASNRLAQFATVGKGVAYPVWNPAGARVVGLLGGSIDNPLVEVDPDNGASSPYLKQDASWRLPTSWSEDGRVILYLEMRPGRLRDLCYLTLDGAPEAHDYLSTPANEEGGKLSPDGKWIAYLTDASGQLVLVVDRFPVPAKARRVASGLPTAGIATSAWPAHWWGSPVRTVGGGQILNPIPPKHKRFNPGIIQGLKDILSSGPEALIGFHLEASGHAGTCFADLRLTTSLTDKQLELALQGMMSARTIIQIDKETRTFVHKKSFDTLVKAAAEHLKGYHQAFPLKSGMLKEELKSKFPPDTDVNFSIWCSTK